MYEILNVTHNDKNNTHEISVLYRNKNLNDNYDVRNTVDSLRPFCTTLRLLSHKRMCGTGESRGSLMSFELGL